jgi:uncharacterized protein (UPF0333 family)
MLPENEMTNLQHLTYNSGPSPQIQVDNSFPVGEIFQCPVWVDLGEQSVADIASIVLAKGLDSGIPIEIKLRLSLSCLYIPLTIFGICVLLAVVFLGILCFYTKSRTLTKTTPLRGAMQNRNFNASYLASNSNTITIPRRSNAGSTKRYRLKEKFKNPAEPIKEEPENNVGLGLANQDRMEKVNETIKKHKRGQKK